MIREKVKLIECPRDAMQGLNYFIPTDQKLHYLKTLLQVGFDTIDFGSFVSPKAIPQMADTHELIRGIREWDKKSKLLAIIANLRGAKEAIGYELIDCLGFPFSVSETFQIRNTNSTISQSIDRVHEIADLCHQYNKSFVVYLSMAFGNPYGDPWNSDIIAKYIDMLRPFGCQIFALSDTIGIASPDSIYYLFESLIPAFPDLELGAHLHTTPQTWEAKIHAATLSGCRRFDGAIRGYGGCPMAKDELTGNMPMECIIDYFTTGGYDTNINKDLFANAILESDSVFKTDV